MSTDDRNGRDCQLWPFWSALERLYWRFTCSPAAVTVFTATSLATLDDARHLAWGYVAYPPVTPFFGWISLKLFAASLTGFRLFAAASTSVAVILTGLMARELGGRTGRKPLPPRLRFRSRSAREV